MIANVNAIMGFWRSVFSESDGTVSMSRVTTFLLCLCGIFIAAFVAIKQGQVPDNLPGLAAFMIAPYAANRASNFYAEVIAAKGGKG